MRRKAPVRCGTEEKFEVISLETHLLSSLQTAKIKANKVVTLEFLNQPAGSLVIVKRDSLIGKPLEGVTFKVTGQFPQAGPEGLHAVDWSIVSGTVYKRATLRLVDTSTPEYQVFEEQLYGKSHPAQGQQQNSRSEH